MHKTSFSPVVRPLGRLVARYRGTSPVRKLHRSTSLGHKNNGKTQTLAFIEEFAKQIRKFTKANPIIDFKRKFKPKYSLAIKQTETEPTLKFHTSNNGPKHQKLLHAHSRMNYRERHTMEKRDSGRKLPKTKKHR